MRSGGEGINDIVSYASATRSGVIVSLAAGKAKGDGHDGLSGFEDVVGSPQGDEIVGDGGANRIDGGVGDDNLDSGGGNDLAYGGPGSDDCAGFAGETSCGPEEPHPPGRGPERARSCGSPSAAGEWIAVLKVPSHRPRRRV